MFKPTSFKDKNFWGQFKSKVGDTLLPLDPSKPRATPSLALPKTSVPILTPEFKAEQARKKKEMVAFVNQLRCPLCKDSQLDGEASAGKASIYCLHDPHHYTAEYNAHHKLTSYILRLFFPKHTYRITAHTLNDNQADFVVTEMDSNLSLVNEYRSVKEIMRFRGALPEIDLTLSEEDFLADLKLFALLS